MVGLRAGWIKDRKNLYGFVKQALLRCKRACLGIQDRPFCNVLRVSGLHKCCFQVLQKCLSA